MKVPNKILIKELNEKMEIEYYIKEYFKLRKNKKYGREYEKIFLRRILKQFKKDVERKKEIEKDRASSESYASLEKLYEKTNNEKEYNAWNF